MSVFKSIQPRLSPTQVAAKTLQRVTKGASSFGKPVVLTGRQLNAFETALKKLAKTQPAKTAKLLFRTITLNEKGLITVKLSNPTFPWSSRNAFVSMVDDVAKAINKADPTVKTPKPMPHLKGLPKG